MRFQTIIFIFLVTAYSASGQFVNGGFEVNFGFPNNIGQWHLADGWGNAGSDQTSPDYYHTGGTLGGDLPQTPVAFLLPYEGEAVMGFIATGTHGLNRRTYLSNELETPSEEGRTYQVSFAITNGFITEGSFSGLGTSHLGMCFTIGEPVQNGHSPMNLEPQFQLQSVEYHREWKVFTFSFTADSDFTHMTFGVFGNDNGKTITAFEPNNPTLAYYFVDDFKIEERPAGMLQEFPDAKGEVASINDDFIDPLFPDDKTFDFFIPNAFTPNGDGDNDIFKPVVNEHLSNYVFCIYSRWGELIFKTTDPSEGWDGNTSGDIGAGVGVYVWEIRYNQWDADGVLHEAHHRGMVNLIR